MTESASSATETIARFGTPAAAAKYAGALDHTATHRREVNCIMRGLGNLPRRSRVLDLPCGTGRLLPALIERGWILTEVDSSPHMVDEARRLAKAVAGADGTRFLVASVFETGLAADSFDAVVCNRLFHHLRESATRREALAELRRVCRGPIVISFFCTLALDAWAFFLKQAIRGRPATDRIPISKAAMARDLHAAGLEPRKWMATRPGVSRQWYVVAQRTNAAHGVC